MNQRINSISFGSNFELRKAQVDMLLADPFVPVIRQDNRLTASKIGRGKLSWQGPSLGWVLSYDTSSLGENADLFLPHIKEFYAYFKAIEFYPEYMDYLLDSFLDVFDDEEQKIRFASIMLNDLESTNDTHITGEDKIDAKKKIVEKYDRMISEYWGAGDTGELAIVTDVRDSLAKTVECARFDAAE